MSRSFGLVDSKVMEAEYFLDRILAANLDFFGVQCDAVAFASSARSITFAMQASLAGNPEFDAWYAKKQQALRADPIARFFHEFRRISQHIGDNAVCGGTYGAYGASKARFLFGPLPDLPEVPEPDVAVACSRYFKSTLGIVYDCYSEFRFVVDGQWHMTAEHWRSQGKTIEDAEVALGYPRGWTALYPGDEAERWHLLRRDADGCNIQSQFERWLGKRHPHPEDVE
jgi:hypothetical protein